MLCEMCSSSAVAFKVEIEGSRLSVCEKCSRYGKVLGKVERPQTRSKQESYSAPSKITETVQIIKDDFASQVKKARERLNLTQEELARKMMEKESLLHNVESGHLKPDITLARKLEKFLKITIVEQVELGPMGQKQTSSSAGLTIGDLLSKK